MPATYLRFYLSWLIPSAAFTCISFAEMDNTAGILYFV